MCYNVVCILDGFLSIVDSEEADSDDGRPPPADHPVREPDPAAAAALDGQMPTEWMRNITSTLVSLQNSFSLFSSRQESKKNRRRSGVAVSSAEER